MRTNKWLKIATLMALLLVFMASEATAQLKRKDTDDPETPTVKTKSTNKASRNTKKTKTKTETDDYFDESGGFKHRLWYGGGFTFNMGGTSLLNMFQLGLTPMVGYKIIGELSVGPRMGFDYRYIKGLTNYNETQSFSVTNYSLGLFARYKFGNFFAHAEYMNDWLRDIYVNGNDQIILDADKKLLVEKRTVQTPSLGIGYTSGGVVGYEILLLYNARIANDNTTLELPFNFRIGLNYKF